MCLFIQRQEYEESPDSYGLLTPSSAIPNCIKKAHFWLDNGASSRICKCSLTNCIARDSKVQSPQNGATNAKLGLQDQIYSGSRISTYFLLETRGF